VYIETADKHRDMTRRQDELKEAWNMERINKAFVAAEVT
jgi:hypothetical protein